MDFILAVKVFTADFSTGKEITFKVTLDSLFKKLSISPQHETYQRLPNERNRSKSELSDKNGLFFLWKMKNAMIRHRERRKYVKKEGKLLPKTIPEQKKQKRKKLVNLESFTPFTALFYLKTTLSSIA